MMSTRVLIIEGKSVIAMTYDDIILGGVSSLRHEMMSSINIFRSEDLEDPKISDVVEGAILRLGLVHNYKIM
jgi:hypothetical protein